MPGSIQIDHFTTLDGVAQAPGGPDEDADGGFSFGGWQAPLLDGTVGSQVDEGIRSMDALLLGRRTYEIFAAYWPHQLDGPDSGIAQKFDSIPKYVASRGQPTLDWRHSHLLGRDLRSELMDLRERHRDIHVIGSIDFARTLVADNLFDRLNLWVYPIVVGKGKRLFPDDGHPTALELLATAGPSRTEWSCSATGRPEPSRRRAICPQTIRHTNPPTVVVRPVGGVSIVGHSSSLAQRRGPARCGQPSSSFG